MSHGLEYELIVDQISNEKKWIIPFVGKEKPWWDSESMKACFITDRPITKEDIEINTNLKNIIVEKRPYYIDKPNQKFESSKDVFYLIRQDNQGIVNNNVSPRYQVIQHSYSLDKAEELRIKFPHISYYSSGVLFGGKVFWVQLEQDMGYIVNDDKAVLTLMFLSNHAGSNSIYTTIQRVVCNNTLQLSLSNTNQQLLINHVGNTNLNYSQLLSAFDADTMQFRESLDMFRYWNSLELQSREIEQLIRYSLNLQEDANFANSYLYKNAIRLLEEQKGVELLKGKYTAYRVFNALTEVTHYVRQNQVYHSLFGKVTDIISRFKSKIKN